MKLLFIFILCFGSSWQTNDLSTPKGKRRELDISNHSSYCAGMLKCVLGFCLPLNYQKLESPKPDGAVHVDINVEILDILSVNDKEFSITMSMYFRYLMMKRDHFN